MPPAYRYGVFDHDTPAVFSATEAYIFTGAGKWEPLHMADVMNGTAVVSKEEFESRFPKLPPIPAGAFRPPKSTAAA